MMCARCFDDRAKCSSIQLSISMHRGLVIAAGVVGAAMAALARARR
jgi:hypothetical protein